MEEFSSHVVTSLANFEILFFITTTKSLLVGIQIRENKMIGYETKVVCIDVMLREIYSSLSQIFISILLKSTFPILMRIHFKFCNDESFNLK